MHLRVVDDSCCFLYDGAKLGALSELKTWGRRACCTAAERRVMGRCDVPVGLKCGKAFSCLRRTAHLTLHWQLLNIASMSLIINTILDLQTKCGVQQARCKRQKQATLLQLFGSASCLSVIAHSVLIIIIHVKCSGMT